MMKTSQLEEHDDAPEAAAPAEAAGEAVVERLTVPNRARPARAPGGPHHRARHRARRDARAAQRDPRHRARPTAAA